MADEMTTAGSAIKGISPLLGAIPYVGPILSTAGTIAGGALEMAGAKKQADQAAKMREAALNTQKQALRPEYLQKKRMDEMLALQGLPGYENILSNIDATTAANYRNIRESTGNGASRLNAIMTAINLGNQAKTNVGVQNANAKIAAKERLGDTMWAIGDKERSLEDRRDAMKREGLAAAMAMENAATANKLNAAKGIIGGITEGANQIGSNVIAQDNNQKAYNLMQAYLQSPSAISQNLPQIVNGVQTYTPTSITAVSTAPLTISNPYTVAQSPNANMLYNNQYSAIANSPFYTPSTSYGFW